MCQKCEFIVSHQKFNSSLKGEKQLVNIHEFEISNCAIQGESCPYWCPLAYWLSYKSDPVCQGAATISMKLVQPYRGPWASQRWTAIWRLCRPFCVYSISHLSGTEIENHDGMTIFGIFWYQDRKKMNPLRDYTVYFSDLSRNVPCGQMNLIHL